MDVLVLGAGGCGSFLHDPLVDAQIWKDVLKKYEGHFTAVIFAILPDRNSPNNVKAFQDAFSS